MNMAHCWVFFDQLRYLTILVMLDKIQTKTSRGINRMNTIKKMLSVAAMSLLGFGTQAEGITVGTGVLADLGGALNAYVEMDLNSQSALSVEVATFSDFKYGGVTFSGTGLGVAYKYFPDYSGLFFKGGVATVTVSSGSNSVAGLQPMALAGYEAGSGRLVYGVEAGWGTTAGMGILNLYVGFNL
jgi:hypothetical protein